MEKERQKEADFLDLLAALYEGRRLILGGTLALCVLAGTLSFLVPEEFESTAQILPPKGSRPTWVVGCADNVNFGQMVFDPLDMEEGRSMNSADGEARALASQRYREGLVTPLEKSDVDTSAP